MRKMKSQQRSSPKKGTMAGRIGKINPRSIPSSKSEHPLILAFINSIDQTSEDIRARVDQTSATCLEDFRTRLGDIQQRCLKLNLSAEAKEHMITQPTGEIILEWESVDKERSGKTTVKSRIRKLEKLLIAEEVSIGREMEQLQQVTLELKHIAKQIVGKDMSEEICPADLDVSLFDAQRDVSGNMHGIHFELEAEESQWLDVVETANMAAMKQMVESEKELNLRHNKMRQSFYQLLSN